MAEREHEYCCLEENVAMCPPAVRAVLVVAWADDVTASRHEVYPVLAIRSFLRRDYVAPRSGGRDRQIGATHREMIELGWRPHGPVPAMVHTEGIFVDEVYGLMGSLDDLVCGEKAIVACPWPPEDDPARLAGTIAKLEGQAVRLDAAKKAQPGPAR